MKLDPATHKFMGEVTMGFYQSKITGKMQIVITPKPADENDNTTTAITALYTAAVQKALETISQAIQQAGLIEQLSKLK